MNGERERLIELLLESEPIKERDLDDDLGENEISDIAEYLLENGVIVLPVKVGQTVYVIPKYNGKPYCGIQADKVQMIGITSRGIHIKTRNNSPFNKTYFLGKTVFLTKEEAEKALKGGVK